MSEQPGLPEPSQLRASDADRERVAKVLHDAMAEGRLTMTELEERLSVVYAAKTFGELVPVTQDLPVAAQSMPVMPGQAVARPAATVDRVGGAPGPLNSIAIMSGVDRRGAWVVPSHHQAVAIMGGVKLDLTEARFAEQETTIQVYTFWGGVDIIVPDDVNVQVNGFGFMGAFDDRTGSAESIPGAPVVRITGFAMMAGVDVRRPKRKKPKKLKDAEDRDQLEQ
ncbi:DUF1707 domain-containing protein [Solihabitans fulvus]|uniref:DUF1707 domain-containing protein n=1 Tax=Solihabitans fulvus TaxID=1892852 RepID=A0A5B2WKZ4_9PSEU|nr:DUF1707 domain-containing protein [Solihabitans fulvus]KAA2251166.1 DUF1707 domain-containing protein [Solihabitans fulvus]